MVVVDVVEEKKVSKVEEYIVVGGVGMRFSQAIVKAMRLQGWKGEALGSRSPGEDNIMYC